MSSLATLPEKKQKYVKERIKGKSKVQAALAAGYAPGTANIAGLKVETPDVKAVFRALCAKAAPMDKLAARLEEGLNACDTEFAKFEGKITDQRDVISWSERRAYMELAANWSGYVDKAGPAAPGWSQSNVIINCAPPEREMLSDAAPGDQPAPALLPVLDVPSVVVP